MGVMKGSLAVRCGVYLSLATVTPWFAEKNKRVSLVFLRPLQLLPDSKCYIYPPCDGFIVHPTVSSTACVACTWGS